MCREWLLSYFRQFRGFSLPISLSLILSECFLFHIINYDQYGSVSLEVIGAAATHVYLFPSGDEIIYNSMDTDTQPITQVSVANEPALVAISPITFPPLVLAQSNGLDLGLDLGIHSGLKKRKRQSYNGHFAPPDANGRTRVCRCDVLRLQPMPRDCPPFKCWTMWIERHGYQTWLDFMNGRGIPS